MNDHTLFVLPNGDIKYLYTAGVPLQELGTIKLTRLSHITPVCAPIKGPAFRLLRWLFGDRGRIAAWTRTWKGPWLVEILATGEWSVFNKRSDAVAWEIERINLNHAKFDL